MKIIFILSISLGLSFISCSKKNSTPTTPPQPPVEQEANIVFGIDPDPSAGIAAAQSTIILLR